MKIYSLWLAAKNFYKRKTISGLDGLIEAFTGRKYFASLERKCEDYARKGNWDRYKIERNYLGFKKTEARISLGMLFGVTIATVISTFAPTQNPPPSVNERAPCLMESIQAPQPFVTVGIDGGIRLAKDDGYLRTVVAFKDGALEMTETTPTGSRKIVLTGDRALFGGEAMKTIRDWEQSKGKKMPIEEAERSIDTLSRRLMNDLTCNR